MRDQTTEKSSAEHPRMVPLRRFVVLMTLSSLDALVLGGCIALLVVSRLLNSQVDVYTTSQSMPAASAILDFMDDLLPLYLTYGFALLALVSSTVCVATWMASRSRLLRSGVILLCLIVLLALGGVGLLKGVGAPVPLPMTPTPPN